MKTVLKGKALSRLFYCFQVIFPSPFFFFLISIFSFLFYIFQIQITDIIKVTTQKQGGLANNSRAIAVLRIFIDKTFKFPSTSRRGLLKVPSIFRCRPMLSHAVCRVFVVSFDKNPVYICSGLRQLSPLRIKHHWSKLQLYLRARRDPRLEKFEPILLAKVE